MQDHQDIQVKALRPVFWGGTSYDPGDKFQMAEEAAVREGLSGFVGYEFNSLSNRAKAYHYRLTHPVIAGPPALY